MGQQQFDVFLSHNSADKPAVEELAQRLKAEGIESWLDKWHLIPGEPWQPALERALEASESVAVFVGPSGLGPWQNEEMRAAISRRVTQSEGRFRVIPILLPGGTREERSRLPTFLVASTWVEFRKSLDEAEAYHRLKAGIRGLAPGPQPGETAYAGQCPYRGLKPFRAEHAAFFFGREGRIEWLLNELLPASTEGIQTRENRFLGVIGASGSGKSSLVRAGLIPALEQGRLEGSSDWPIVIVRPGQNPLEGLAVALASHVRIGPRIGDARQLMDHMEKDETRLHLAARVALGSDSETQRLVIVIDQFEEVFTLQSNDVTSIQSSHTFQDMAQLDPGLSIRKAFIDNLMYAASMTGGKTIVVLTMRADFYGKCASFANLAAALSDHQDLVGPMTPVELREVIERPAQRVGLELERGLTEILLKDMANQPGALPLLQHALFELWQRREGRRLTIKAYEAIGGLEGALEKQANDVFNTFNADEQAVCRRIFLRLTQPGEGSEDTKRRVAISQIGESAATKSVVQRLMNVRLITAESLPNQPNEAFVEVSHEALIRNWPRLRNWVDEDRESLRNQHRLTEASIEWRESGRDVGFLYVGARLAEAEEWSQTPEADLTPLEAEFLAASLERRDRDKRDEAQRQSRELETLKKLANSEHERATDQAAAARRSTRYLRGSLALSALALAAFFWAMNEQRKAVESARVAEVAKIEALESETSVKVAQSKIEVFTKEIQDEYAMNLLERIHTRPSSFGVTELSGLWRIAGLPPEREHLRNRLLSIGLSNTENGDRISTRAPYVAQAMVGLNRERRDQFLTDHILPSLARSSPPSVRLACARLGLALQQDGVDFAEQAVQILAKALTETADQGLHDSLGEDLKVAVKLIPRSESQRAVIPVVEAMQRCRDLRILRRLCEAVADDPPRIQPIDGRRIFEQLMTALENRDVASSQREALRELHQCVVTLPAALEVVDVDRGIKLLVHEIVKTGKPEIRTSLVQVATALSTLLNSSQARKGAGLFLRAVEEAEDSQDARAFAECLTAVASQLAKSDAEHAIEVVMKAMQKTSMADPLKALSEGLLRLPCKISDDGARHAVARLLTVIEESKGRNLRVLAECLALFASRSAVSESDLSRAKSRLFQEIQSSHVALELNDLVQGLTILPNSLSLADSTSLVKLLVVRLQSSSNPEQFVALSEALRSVGARMTPEAAETAAQSIIEAMKFETWNTERIRALTHGLRGMEFEKKTVLTVETVLTAYRIVLSKMGEGEFSHPMHLSFLAESMGILPGDTPEEIANSAIQILQAGVVQTKNSKMLEYFANSFGALGGNLSSSAGQQSVKQFLREIESNSETDVRCILIFGLAALAIDLDQNGLFPDEKASVVASQLVYAMDVTEDEKILQKLADALSRIAPQLEEKDPVLRKVFDQIRISMESTDNPDVIAVLAEMWESLAMRMTVLESQNALQQILVKIKTPLNRSAQTALKNAAVAIIRTSDSSQRIVQLERSLSALRSELEPHLLDVFLTGIEKLATMVDPENVNEAKDALLAVTTSYDRINDQIMDGIVAALDALPGEIETRELIEILKSPFCTGKARSRLLRLLEKRLNLTFDDNPWKLVEKGTEAGIKPEIFDRSVKTPGQFKSLDPDQ